jgi:uncharacterized paraquat-inducible protein A
VAHPSDLIRTRCVIHAQREAAARCPECGGYFCRECVTEHGERAICAACLRRLAPAGTEGRRRPWWVARRAAQLLLGILAAWFFFYMIGTFLSSLPDSFHEATRAPGAQDGS